LPNSFGYHLLPLYGQEQIYKLKHFSKYLFLCSTGKKSHIDLEQEENFNFYENYPFKYIV